VYRKQLELEKKIIVQKAGVGDHIWDHVQLNYLGRKIIGHGHDQTTPKFIPQTLLNLLKWTPDINSAL
jgi:hypothetical protein